MGTLLMASPASWPSTLTAMESRLVTGMVPSSANLRGETKRRCLLSVVRTRIATSSALQEKAALTAFTTRSHMSSRSSIGSGTLAF